MREDQSQFDDQDGQSLNLGILAHGVEMFEEMEFPSDQGCNEVQGYDFGEPMPPEQMAQQFQLQ